MKLFDDGVRTDSSRARYAEAEFSFLNRSARPDVGRVRDLVEEWFSRYPVAHQGDLATRFRAPGRRGFEPAFFELFLHELLLRLDFTATVHPELTATPKHPDFLAVGGGSSFFLEAAVVRDETTEEAADRVRESLVYDALNELDSPNFFLRVQIIESSTRTPSGRLMRHFLSPRLQQLDPDGALPDGWQYSGQGWRVFFQPIAKGAASRHQPGIRPVGMLAIRSKWIKTRDAIKTEMAGKATRYGILDKPYVIALNVTSEWGCDDDDVTEALFGTVSEVFQSAPEGLQHVGTRRNRDGAWQGPQGPRNTRNSPVLVIKGAAPWNVASVSMRLYHNPHAQRPLGTSFDQLPHAVVENHVLQMIDGIDSAALFSLSPAWPQQPRTPSTGQQFRAG